MPNPTMIERFRVLWAREFPRLGVPTNQQMLAVVRVFSTPQGKKLLREMTELVNQAFQE